jgi:RHH-type transcriptional regulator, proline utilization regulon repressor / proline dehydrogenase / delta 1-pyrroline-5-carboxylate dehydrogenase
MVPVPAEPRPAAGPAPDARGPLELAVAEDALAARAVTLAGTWLTTARRRETASERRRGRLVHRLLASDDGLRFAMAFTDRVLRAPTAGVAAAELHDLVERAGSPRFLGPVDRMLLRAGAGLAPRLPRLVVPLARRRLRSLIGDLVLPAGDPELRRHIARRREAGLQLNLNRLGEAVLGEAESQRRLDAAVALLQRPDVDHVSVKVSSIASQLVLWDLDAAAARVADRLRPLYRTARDRRPPGFVNLDMEEYRDLDLTVAVFRHLLDDDEFATLDAGIVLQAYLPDSHAVLDHLLTWAAERHAAGGSEIAIRIVKGANLAMERVDAELHGWPQATYLSKDDTDASYVRLLDHAFHPDRLVGARIGVASHNLFDVAWAHALAVARGVTDHVRFEMLQGMAPRQAEAVAATTGSMLLYTPIVDEHDFAAAIAYLFRRLEENAAPQDFLHHLATLAPGTDAFRDEQARFEASLEHRFDVATGSRRTQDRRAGPVPVPPGTRFANEPDTDPALAENRAWVADALAAWQAPDLPPPITTSDGIDVVVACARDAAARWAATSPRARAAALHRVADVMARRRGEIVATMAHEAGKVVAEGDTEVSEGIDFARWYASSALDLGTVDGVAHAPVGVVVVTPPWNFPFAIPAGGVLAALAAGDAVVLKPAPETPCTAFLVASCCWEAGVPADVVQFLQCPDGDVGRHLVTHPGVDAVVLTGSYETARLFLDWRPDLHLLGETSGKNALVVTARADLDQAVADVVRSAFGHAGQKCSAASLVIAEADAHDHPPFLRQLADAVASLAVGPSTDLATSVGPLIAAPGDALHRALTTLDPGERWLVEPRRLSDDGRLWRPGVKLGVRPGSWFHQTECFGPVLGVMRAADLDEAIAWQNAVPFGLTGGIWSLDAAEVERWLERVEVGNAYVNRHITGAIVRRQPFGGWKRSAVGPGAKAGGPGYVGQLVRWRDDGLPTRRATPSVEIESLLAHLLPHVGDERATWLRAAVESDEHWWRTDLALEHDPSALRAESNVLRYRPLPRGVLLRLGRGATAPDVARVVLAARRCGTPVTASADPGLERIDAVLESAGVTTTVEDDDALAARAVDVAGAVDRVRLLGTTTTAARRALVLAGLFVDDRAVVANGRVELVRLVREQAVSRTRHRYGTVLED